MKRLLLLICLGGALSSIAIAQGTYDPWTFSKLLIDTQEPQSNGTGFHGVVVAPDGNIWLALHGDLTGDTLMTATDTLSTRPIYVLGPDGSHVSFSPIRVLEFPDGSKDTLCIESIANGDGKGISVDKDGNILYTAWSTVYRINSLTGAGMNKYTPTKMGSMTEAVQDDNGNIYVGYVSSGNPIIMLDNDFNYVGNAIDTLKYLNRTLAITGDGKDLYTGSTWNGFGIVHLHSDAPGFTEYTIVDTIGNWYNYPDTTSTGADTTITVKLWASSLDWDNSGILWAGNLRPDWSGPKGAMYYGFDVSTGLIIDSVGVAMGDSSAGGTYSPRGAAWSADGYTMYLADFDYNVVSVWTNANPVVLSIPDNDRPFVMVGYALAQNYPNPFNPSTRIMYEIAKTEFTNLVVYNLLGQSVRVLMDGIQTAGEHRIIWDGRNSEGILVPSGIYIYRLKTGTVTLSKRMVLLK